MICKLLWKLKYVTIFTSIFYKMHLFSWISDFPLIKLTSELYNQVSQLIWERNQWLNCLHTILRFHVLFQVQFGAIFEKNNCRNTIDNHQTLFFDDSKKYHFKNVAWKSSNQIIVAHFYSICLDLNVTIWIFLISIRRSTIINKYLYGFLTELIY